MPATPLYRRPVPRATLEELRRLYYQCNLQECYDRGQAILDTAAGLPDREPGDGEVPLEMVVEVVLEAEGNKGAPLPYSERIRRAIRRSLLPPDGFYYQYHRHSKTLRRGQYRSIIRSCRDVLLPLAEGDLFRRTLVDILECYAGRYIEPQAYARRLRDLSAEFMMRNDMTSYFKVSSSLAETLCYLGQYIEAESISHHVLSMAMEYKLHGRIAGFLISLMIAAIKTGRASTAISYHERYSPFLVPSPSAKFAIHLLHARALAQLGHYESARTMTRECLEMSRRSGSTRNTALALETLGDIDLREEDIVGAEHNFHGAQEIYSHLSPKSGDIAGILRRLGQLANISGKHHEALTTLSRALDLAECAREEYEKPVILRELALAHGKVGNIKSALNNARRAMRRFEEMNCRLDLALTHETLARILVQCLEDHYPSEVPDNLDLQASPMLEAWASLSTAVRILGELERKEDADRCRALMDQLRQSSSSSSHWHSGSSSPIPTLVANSEIMRPVLDWMEIAANSNDPVLIFGESGTGKEVVARSIHARSQRRHGPFVVVNCGAIPSTLFEREFFGHASGAYTGSGEGAPGLLEQAEGGALLLDEICDLALPLQAKLLRVIQDGTYRRLGDPEKRHADVRFMAASIEPLEPLVREGRFRADLYYRLQALEISLPPLRDRMEDLEPLIAYFLEQLLGEASAPRSLFPDDVWQALHRYSWPGNVREVESVMRRLSVLYRHHGRISLEMLPAEITNHLAPAGQEVFPTIEQRAKQMERDAIREALIVAGGNRTRAAMLLGISRQNLYKMMNRLGVTPDEDRSADQSVD